MQRGQAHSGAVTLIQRFGSAANLNIHLHCLVLDGVYRGSVGVPVFHDARAPSMDELPTLLGRIIHRPRADQPMWAPLSAAGYSRRRVRRRGS